MQTSAGTFTYEVKGTRIVHEDDKTVIVPTDHAVLTMTHKMDNSLKYNYNKVSPTNDFDNGLWLYAGVHFVFPTEVRFLKY